MNISRTQGLKKNSRLWILAVIGSITLSYNSGIIAATTDSTFQLPPSSLIPMFPVVDNQIQVLNPVPPILSDIELPYIGTAAPPCPAGTVSIGVVSGPTITELPIQILIHFHYACASNPAFGCGAGTDGHDFGSQSYSFEDALTQISPTIYFSTGGNYNPYPSTAFMPTVYIGGSISGAQNVTLTHFGGDPAGASVYYVCDQHCGASSGTFLNGYIYYVSAPTGGIAGNLCGTMDFTPYVPP
jgi:hypothetical protein